MSRMRRTSAIVLLAGAAALMLSSPAHADPTDDSDDFDDTITRSSCSGGAVGSLVNTVFGTLLGSTSCSENPESPTNQTAGGNASGGPGQHSGHGGHRGYGLGW
jgi:hypothetical protein